MPNQLSLLIVEDSATDANLTIAHLERWGYTIQSERVSDASAMRAAIASQSWDVVVCDWSLPGFGAPEALHLLQELGVDIPFIIVSGVVDDDVAVDAMRRGAHDYVSKENLARLGAAIQREVAQARLRRERAKKHDQDERFFTVTPDLLCVVGFDGQFKRLNPAWQPALGWTSEELCSRPYIDFLHPEDRAAATGRLEGLLAGSGATLSWQARYVHKDGGYRYLEWTATPFTEERVVYAAARDVTERKKTEDALRASQARFERLAESGIIAIAIADLVGNYHEVNEAYCRLFGYSREELLSGKVSWVAMTPPEWHASDAVAVAALQETGVASPWEKEIFRKDGTRVPVLIGVAMLDGTSCITFIADLTERKRAEEALRRSEALHRHSQKMEALGQLAAGVAHEINTPAQYVTDNLVFLQTAFGGLIGAARLATAMVAQAKDGPVSQNAFGVLEAAFREADIDFVAHEVPRALDQSLEGIRRVSSIVSAMKTFSHPSAAEKKPTDLREIIETTISVARNRWKYVADLKTDYDAKLPAVLCLRDELSQAILNLVVNAADAVSDQTNAGANGKGTITVSTRADGEWAEIRVVDSGTGIPEAIQSRIFDPFFTTKPVGKGSGQGLAIAYGVIVDKHAGHISFETAEGKGTTFILRVPMGAPTALPPTLPTRRSHKPKPRSQSSCRNRSRRV